MKNNQPQIIICGIGPGNPDYICPIVFKKVKLADIVIGGKRHLDIFNIENKKNILFNGRLDDLKQAIENNKSKNITIVVSGDTGFYSLRKFIVNSFPELHIEVIPGISSFQYLYAKLGLGYENAFKGSLHGKEVDYIKQIQSYDSVFLLTDKKNTWKVIAQNLVKNGMGEWKFHIGNNLSYPNEKIISTTALDASKMNHDFELCSVIFEKCMM